MVVQRGGGEKEMLASPFLYTIFTRNNGVTGINFVRGQALILHLAISIPDLLF